MKTYPAYKDSGVDWLGEIPEHWEVEKGKWLFIKNERPVREKDEVVTCFRDGEVTLRSNRRIDGFTNSVKEHGYQGVRKGDLVIHQMDAFAGSIGISDSDGKSTPVYSVLTPRVTEVMSEFYSRLLRNMAKTGFIESLAKGIRERSTDFRFNDFSKLVLPFPPKQEQQAIANFLDETCGKLETVVAQKEKMIALLKERKQALIQNAVTRGLNENVQMKDSGVDWIGEIPENWKVKRLKFVSEIRNNKLYAKESELPYLGMENVESWSGKLIETESESEGLANVYKSGDVLFGKLRPYLAKAYLADHDGLCSSEFLPFISSDNLTNKFLKNIILSFRFINQIDSSTYGSKMPRANPDYIKNTLIPIPAKEEQEKIVNYIDAQSQKLDQAVTQQEQAIIKIKEYKASLIDSCVLGKIKVS